MTKVLQVTKLRFFALALSIILIAVGITGTILRGGFDLGIDFSAGLNLRVQIAPIVMEVTYSGEGSAELNILGNALTIQVTRGSDIVESSFPLVDYDSLAELENAIGEIDGIGSSVDDLALSYPASTLLGLNRALELSTSPVAVNALQIDDPLVEIGTVRQLLTEFGNPLIQVIGAPENHEFAIRLEESEGAIDFDQERSRRLVSLLEAEFGSGSVIIRRSDYVGSRFSRNLGQQTVYLSLFSLGLILVYIWFRFRLAYAVSSIVALIHDVLIMGGFIGITQMEVGTATIAAGLTIIGYSLNDTIVIFDRVRENLGLLRETELHTVVNTSITQSLSRTLMTSLTTLLAVLAIFIFSTGSIKDFALALIVGIVVGTYSSVFVASPIFVGWMSRSAKMKKAKDAQRYGSGIETKREAAPDSNDEPNSPETPAGPVVIPMAERKLKGKRKKKR